jgi:hypothetical protein
LNRNQNQRVRDLDQPPFLPFSKKIIELDSSFF